MKLKELLSERKQEGTRGTQHWVYTDPPAGYIFILRPRPGMVVYRWEKGKVGESGTVLRKTEKGNALVEFRGKTMVVPKNKLLTKSKK